MVYSVSTTQASFVDAAQAHGQVHHKIETHLKELKVTDKSFLDQMQTIYMLSILLRHDTKGINRSLVEMAKEERKASVYQQASVYNGWRGLAINSLKVVLNTAAGGGSLVFEGFDTAYKAFTAFSGVTDVAGQISGNKDQADHTRFNHISDTYRSSQSDLEQTNQTETSQLHETVRKLQDLLSNHHNTIVGMMKN